MTFSVFINYLQCGNRVLVAFSLRYVGGGAQNNLQIPRRHDWSKRELYRSERGEIQCLRRLGVSPRPPQEVGYRA